MEKMSGPEQRMAIAVESAAKIMAARIAAGHYSAYQDSDITEATVDLAKRLERLIFR